VRILSHAAKPDQRLIGFRVSGYSSKVPRVPESVTIEDLMIEARGLRKSFGDFEAVRGIDLAVRRGEAFGFLGPNGAGKSSTMRMIAAVSPISGGELRILGRDPATEGPAIRGRLGVCPQDDTLDTELTVFDNLFIYGRYF
jgi:lipooligosaccharide transport system ATP-binding protein